MLPEQAKFSLRRYTVGLALTISLIAGCSLPEPDGTEKALIERAAGLPALEQGQGKNPRSVVRNGLLLSPSVRAAASQVSASADEVRVQRAAIFPSLGISIGAGAGAAGEGDPQVDLTGRQLILDFGKTKRAVTSADLDLQINYVTFQQSVDTAIFDVLEAYDLVRRNVLLLEVRRNQLTAMRKLQSLVADRTRIGAAPTSDLLETRKRLQAAEFLVHDTELALAEARDRLAQLSGQPRGGRIPNFSNGSCAAPALSDDIRKARLELAKAQIDLENAEKARQPRAYLEPLARHKVGEGGVSVGVNVGIDSDLLQGGALSARVNAARNTLESANANIEAAQRDDILEQNRLKREIAGASRRSVLLRRQIDLLVQTRVLYRSQYFDLGTREVSELLDNEEEYYNRQAELVETNSDFVADQIECAIRERRLRTAMEVNDVSLYGYPLHPDAI